MKVETPAVDVLVGLYHDLFAWGGAGFYPTTIAFLPLLGEVYHRNPQLRLSKTFGGSGALQRQIENGAPIRLKVPTQLGYKSAKYVQRIELVAGLGGAEGNGGYWEDQGYEWFAGI